MELEIFYRIKQKKKERKQNKFLDNKIVMQIMSCLNDLANNCHIDT